MMVIYDFDGTLTPYALPQYEILKKYEYDDSKFTELVKQTMQLRDLSLYQAYFMAYKNILIANKEKFNKETVCLGASSTQFNNGVIEYFSNLQFNKTGIRHYVVSSGFSEYIINTPIAKFLDGVYGTSFKFSNGEYTEPEIIMTDQYKVNVIESIQQKNKIDGENIVYFGDGLTDRNAFEYVHSVGGKTVFISKDPKGDPNLIELKKLGIIDECFEPNFSVTSDAYSYVKSLQGTNKALR